MRNKHRTAVRAFALPELAAVITVVLLTVVLALPAARRARASGWGAVDAENLHRFAGATTAYAADNGDLFWATSWRKGMDLPTKYQDLKGKNHSEFDAATAQVIDIWRRKGGRLDIQFVPNWIPQLYYSHPPLLDYMDQEMPALWTVCPADRHRLDWAKDWDAFDQGEFLPCQPSPNPTNKRWPYSSSYQLGPSFYDQSPVGSRIEQGPGIDSYGVSLDKTETHAVLMSQSVFPSEKVHLFEAAFHHADEGTGPDCDAPRAFVYPDARVAMLFVDGHTAWHKTSDANRGWRPNNPDNPNPTYVSVDGKAFPGVYRWTRQGVAGRDFGGPEVGPP